MVFRKPLLPLDNAIRTRDIITSERLTKTTVKAQIVIMLAVSPYDVIFFWDPPIWIAIKIKWMLIKFNAKAI